MLDDRSYVVDYNVSIFIALQQDQLPSILVVEGVNSGVWHFLVDTHVVDLGYQLLVVSVWFGRRRRAYNKDSNGAVGVGSEK